MDLGVKKVTHVSQNQNWYVGGLPNNGSGEFSNKFSRVWIRPRIWILALDGNLVCMTTEVSYSVRT